MNELRAKYPSVRFRQAKASSLTFYIAEQGDRTFSSTRVEWLAEGLEEWLRDGDRTTKTKTNGEPR